MPELELADTEVERPIAGDTVAPDARTSAVFKVTRVNFAPWEAIHEPEKLSPSESTASR